MGASAWWNSSTTTTSKWSRRDPLDAVGGQRLDDGEDVLPPLRAVAADELLAEGAVAQAPRGRCAASARGSPGGGRRTAVDRAAGSLRRRCSPGRRRPSCRCRSPRRRGCGGGRARCAPTRAPRGSAIWCGYGRTSSPDSCGPADPNRSRPSVSRSRRDVAGIVGVVGLERRVRPVAVERAGELAQQLRRGDRRQPHVPLEAVEQRGPGEVAAAHVGGVEAGVAAEAATPWRAAAWSRSRS